MDIRKVKKLIELLKESNISEIEVHEGEESVRICSHQTVPAAQQTPVVIPATNVIVDPNIPPAATSAPAKDEGHIIKSPMVGIFYVSPSLEAQPFAKLRQNVKKGDTLCIVEAMKIMNQITSDIDGTVDKIFVETGDPVEYGQPLFLIK